MIKLDGKWSIGKIILTALIGIVLSGELGWRVWVTNEIFSAKTAEATKIAADKRTAEDVKEIKKEVKDLREDLKMHNKANEDRQENIYKLLLDLQRQTIKK